LKGGAGQRFGPGRARFGWRRVAAHGQVGRCFDLVSGEEKGLGFSQVKRS
jgi:hypothetical protein